MILQYDTVRVHNGKVVLFIVYFIVMCAGVCVHLQTRIGYQFINPLSAMVAIWHHITISFTVFGTERVHWNFNIFDDMH
jgi:hypothetical protein